LYLDGDDELFRFTDVGFVVDGEFLKELRQLLDDQVSLEGAGQFLSGDLEAKDVARDVLDEFYLDVVLHK
jgi:hypothetical protein